MKKWLVLVLVALFIVGAVVGFLVGRASAGPAGVLPRLQRAINDRDAAALLECYDPQATSLITGLGDKVAGVFGQSMDVDSLGQFLSGTYRDYVQKYDTFPQVKLSAKSTHQVNDKRATVTYTETLIFADGGKSESEQRVTVVKEGNRWYLSLL